MMERFKLPMTKEQAYRLLLAAVKGEVEYRARIFEFNDAVKFYAETIAEWLTGDSPKFGLLLCGNVGNGKSTFVKAFQQLLNQLNIRSETYRDYWKIRIVDARSATYLCKSDYREWEQLCRLPMLAIDDLGTERNVSDGRFAHPPLRQTAIHYNHNQSHAKRDSSEIWCPNRGPSQ